MKKEYFELEIDILMLQKSDVITASDENDKTDDPYSSAWWD